jgi:hypothetical protein
MATITIKLDEFGYPGKEAKLESVSMKVYREFESKLKKDPEDMTPSMELLTKAIVEAPFAYGTVADIDALKMELVGELSFALQDLLGPFLEKMAKRQSGGSRKPTEVAGPKTQS